MSNIDLTYMYIANGEEMTAPFEESKVHDKKEIEPQFTDGVKEFYTNMGKNLPEREIMALLSETPIDYIFDELKRRFDGLNKVIEGVTAIVLNTEPVDVSPERIEGLRADFKQAELLKKNLEEIIKA